MPRWGLHKGRGEQRASKEGMNVQASSHTLWHLDPLWGLVECRVPSGSSGLGPGTLNFFLIGSSSEVDATGHGPWSEQPDSKPLSSSSSAANRGPTGRGELSEHP